VRHHSLFTLHHFPRLRPRLRYSLSTINYPPFPHSTEFLAPDATFTLAAEARRQKPEARRQKPGARSKRPAAERFLFERRTGTEHQRCQFWREFSRCRFSMVPYPPNFPPARGAFWHFLAPLRNFLSAIGTARVSATTDAIDITIAPSALAVGASHAKPGTFRVRRAIFPPTFALSNASVTQQMRHVKTVACCTASLTPVPAARSVAPQTSPATVALCAKPQERAG